MFNMKVEKQLNLNDRTLLLGVPTYDVLPNEIGVEERRIEVKGVSCGLKAPYISIEIERLDFDLTGKTVAS